MTLSRQAVLYGLRNLVTGDDEETRIMDIPIDEVGKKVYVMANRNYPPPDFDGAYRLAIHDAAFDTSHPDGDWDITFLDCLKWSLWFNGRPSLRELWYTLRMDWNEAECMYALWKEIIDDESLD